jgi:hypothetical protein
MVGHLVAGAPDHTALRAELPAVRRIGRQDAVLRVKQNVGLGQPLQEGHEFGQRLHKVFFLDQGSLLPLLAKYAKSGSRHHSKAEVEPASTP